VRARSAAVVAAVAIAVGGLLPSALAGSGPSAPALGSLVDAAVPPGFRGWVAGPDGQVRPATPSLAQLVDSSDWTDPATPLDVLAAHLEARDGVELPDVRRASDPGEGDEGLVNAKEAWSTGDLDGDGRNDVFAFAFENEVLTQSVLSGVDGSLVWERSIAADDWLGMTVPDIDGDGGLDLMSIFVDWSSDDGSRYDLGWRVRAISGATGGDLWTRTQAGYVEWSSTQENSRRRWRYRQSSARRFDMHDMLVVPAWNQASDEIAFTTISGLVESRWESEQRLLRSSTSSNETSRFTSTGILVRGADGASVAELSSEGAAPSVLHSAGQMVGNAEPDWLWGGVMQADWEKTCRRVSPLGAVSALERCQGSDDPEYWWQGTAVDGATLGSSWVSSFALGDPWIDLLAVGDVDGDGLADFGLSEWSGASHLLSGATGAHRWSSPGFWLAGGQDLDGDSDPDALLADIDLDDGSVRVRVDRLDGSSGDLLLSTERAWSFEVTDFSVYGGYLGSVSAGGSPAPDVIGGVFAWSRVSNESAMFVEDGQTGATLHTVASDDSWLWPQGVDDLDGDGAPDIVVADDRYFTEVDENGETVYRYENHTYAVTVGTTARLWTAPDNVNLSLAGDQDGAPGSEVFVFHRPEWSGPAYAESRSGADLSLRWSRTSVLGSTDWTPTPS
jgi:hypothetical protein